MFLQLFDFIALILKIVLLAALYSTAIVGILFLCLRKKKNHWVQNVMERKWWTWLLLHVFISISLYLFPVSYWQNTGFGDNPQLPIGYGQLIYSPDFAWTSFYPDLDKTELNKDELEIKNFIVQNGNLCAEVSHQSSDSPPYDFIVCDLKARTNITFMPEADYTAYATAKGLPMKKGFYDFKQHLQEYFDKRSQWRRWLLP